MFYYHTKKRKHPTKNGSPRHKNHDLMTLAKGRALYKKQNHVVLQADVPEGEGKHPTKIGSL